MKQTSGCSFDITGISLVVGIIFVVLKLCNIISWEWVYVCIPFYVAGGFLLLGIIILIVFLIITWRWTR